MALVVAGALTISMASVAFAGTTTTHTISITTQGNGSHTYTAYQIFKGNLDSTGTKLANIEWGNGIDNTSAFITALQANDTLKASFPAKDGDDNAITYDAASIAKIVSGFNASQTEAFADVAEPYLTVAAGTEATGTKTSAAELSVTGDGYYLVKDTGTIANGDTSTKFILKVLNDITINAKDTLLTPDKEINEVDSDSVTADNSDAAIGDLITFTVTIPVPDTTEYKENFWFVMNDQLPPGMTFNSISSVVVDGSALNYTWPVANYTVTAKTSPATTYSAYTAPKDAEEAVKATGGQAIKVVFKDFKDTVEEDRDTETEGVQNLIGKNMVITYTAYVNDDAVFGATGNENTVHFDYSNNPNHEYDGDEPGSGDDEVTGKTPDSKTKTYVTTLVINKVDDSTTPAALAGATFEITGTTWNYVLETGEKFVASDYEKATGETIQSGTYYKLKDGSYTATAPTSSTTANYDTPSTTYKLVTYSKVVKQAGDNVKLTVTSDQNGKIELDGLKAGTYKIKETIAPSGYNLDTTEHTIIVNWSDPTADGAAEALVSAGGFSLGDGSEGTMSADGAAYSITIENHSGTTLPSTGGMGTTVLYVVGAIIIIGAGVLLITRRRANAAK